MTTKRAFSLKQSLMKVNVNVTHLTFDTREDLFDVASKLFVSAYIPEEYHAFIVTCLFVLCSFRKDKLISWWSTQA